MFEGDEQMFVMNDSDFVTLLILSVIILYPFIAECGAYFRAPVELRCTEETLAALLTALKAWGISDFYSLGALPKEFHRILVTRPQYNVLIFVRSETRYSSDNIEELLDYCVNDSLSNAPHVLTLVLTNTSIQARQRYDFSGYVSLESLSDDILGDLNGLWEGLVGVVLKEQQWLAEKLHQTVRKEEDRGMAVFKCAAECLSLFLVQQGCEEEEITGFRGRLEASIQTIRESWDGGDDPDDVVKLFWNRLVSFCLEGGRELQAMDRMDIRVESIDDVLDYTIFYDDGSYYVGNKMFADVMGEDDGSVRLNLVKEGLSEAGLLVTEGSKRGYYTKRVCLVMSDGSVLRKRLLRFNREKLDLLGDFRLLDFIGMEGGGADGEC